MYFSKLFVVFSLVFMTSAMVTPRFAHHAHRRHAIAARVTASASPAAVPIVTPRKRVNKRCKLHDSSQNASSLSSLPVVNSTSSLPVKAALVNDTSSSQSVSTTVSPTPSVQPLVAPINVGIVPPTVPSDTSANVSFAAPAPSTTLSSVKLLASSGSNRARGGKGGQGGNGGNGGSATSGSATGGAGGSSSSSSGGGGGGGGNSILTGTHSGDGTFYETGLGSCGITNTDNDLIVAVSHLLYDNFPGYVPGNANNNPICGKQLTAHYQGKSVTVMATDRCTGCAMWDLDFSPRAFNMLADPALGRIPNVEWSFD